MGNGNVAIVERIFAAFARRDNAEIMEAYDPDVVWDARALTGLPDLQGVFHGKRGVQDWWRTWLEAWETIDFVDETRHEASGNQVVSSWAQRNRGKGSGVEVEMESAIVWTFENGLIVRVAVFPSRAEAREAAGLPV